MNMYLPDSGYGLERAVTKESTLKAISSGRDWDTDILFRCIWGNTEWLRKLAECLGMGIHVPPFKPIIDDMASKINCVRQHQSHCEARDMLDFDSLRHGRKTVTELLQVLIGHQGAIKSK